LDNTAKVWEAETGRELLTLRGHTSPVTSVALSPDGRRLLTGSGDNTAKVWDAQTGRELLTLRGHTSGVSSVAFSPDGRRLFTWDGRGEMRAWSAEDGKPVPADNPPPRPNSGFAALSPDGRLFALRGYLTLQDVRIINRLRAAPLWPLPDAAERKHYHSEQARLAEQQQQWFAAAFHLGRLLLDEPNNAEWQQRRQQALKKHAAAQPKPAPGKTPPPDKDH
jgi:hypothetical protein